MSTIMGEAQQPEFAAHAIAASVQLLPPFVQQQLLQSSFGGGGAGLGSATQVALKL